MGEIVVFLIYLKPLSILDGAKVEHFLEQNRWSRTEVQPQLITQPQTPNASWLHLDSRVSQSSPTPQLLVTRRGKGGSRETNREEGTNFRLNQSLVLQHFEGWFVWWFTQFFRLSDIIILYVYYPCFYLMLTGPANTSLESLFNCINLWKNLICGLYSQIWIFWGPVGAFDDPSFGSDSRELARMFDYQNTSPETPAWPCTKYAPRLCGGYRPTRLQSSRDCLSPSRLSDRQVLLTERGFESDPLTWVLTKSPPPAKGILAPRAVLRKI